jgi:hypothetical protein
VAFEGRTLGRFSQLADFEDFRRLDLATISGLAIIWVPWTAASLKPKTACPSSFAPSRMAKRLSSPANGRPVAQLAPAPPERRQVRLGGMKDRVQLLPGWDKPIDLDRFLEGDL